MKSYSLVLLCLALLSFAGSVQADPGFTGNQVLVEYVVEEPQNNLEPRVALSNTVTVGDGVEDPNWLWGSTSLDLTDNTIQVTWRGPGGWAGPDLGYGFNGLVFTDVNGTIPPFASASVNLARTSPVFQGIKVEVSADGEKILADFAGHPNLAGDTVVIDVVFSAVDGPTADDPTLYFADAYGLGRNRGTIERAVGPGFAPTVLVETSPFPGFVQGLAVDPQGKKMYWSDGHGLIQRADLDGSNAETILDRGDGLGGPNAIALDVANGHLYFTDPVASRIQRANLDGSALTNIVTGLNGPWGLALDLSGGRMYWTDRPAAKIQRCNLTGGPVEDLVTGLGQPQGIAMDLANGKMYWTDWVVGKIRRANLNGSSVEDLLATGPRSAFFIALDLGAGKMYWTQSLGAHGPGLIRRASLDGTQIEDVITGLGIPVGLAIVPSCPPVFDPALRDLPSRASLLVGTAVRHALLLGDEDACYPRFVEANFTLITPENEAKWGSIQPYITSPRDDAAFQKLDELVAWAGVQTPRVLVKGHPLVWHRQLPIGLSLPESEGGRPNEQKLEILLRGHITELVTRYPTIMYWDVLNEAFTERGGLRSSTDDGWDPAFMDWAAASLEVYGSKKEYIHKVFGWANASNPSATLIYNDFNIAVANRKSKHVKSLIKDILDRRPDFAGRLGVGFQCHFFVRELDGKLIVSMDDETVEEPQAIHPAQVACNLRDFAELDEGNLKLFISELDISISSSIPDANLPGARKLQARWYRELVSRVGVIPNVKAITTWGFTDKHTWRNAPDSVWTEPLLWDRDYGAKAALFSYRQGLRGSAGELVVESSGPVDLEVTDPSGTLISQGAVPAGVVYDEAASYRNSKPADTVVISAPSAGEYRVRVVPHAGADPDATVTVWMLQNGTCVKLFNQVRVADLPDERGHDVLPPCGVVEANPNISVCSGLLCRAKPEKPKAKLKLKVTVRNDSPDSIPAPLCLLVENLPAGVQLIGAHGKTGAGVPYLDLTEALRKKLQCVLGAGESLKVKLEFENPDKTRFTPTLSVLTAGGK